MFWDNPEQPDGLYRISKRNRIVSSFELVYEWTKPKTSFGCCCERTSRVAQYFQLASSWALAHPMNNCIQVLTYKRLQKLQREGGMSLRRPRTLGHTCAMRHYTLRWSAEGELARLYTYRRWEMRFKEAGTGCGAWQIWRQQLDFVFLSGDDC